MTSGCSATVAASCSHTLQSRKWVKKYQFSVLYWAARTQIQSAFHFHDSWMLSQSRCDQEATSPVWTSPEINLLDLSMSTGGSCHTTHWITNPTYTFIDMQTHFLFPSLATQLSCEAKNYLNNTSSMFEYRDNVGFPMLFISSLMMEVLQDLNCVNLVFLLLFCCDSWTILSVPSLTTRTKRTTSRWESSPRPWGSGSRPSRGSVASAWPCCQAWWQPGSTPSRRCLTTLCCRLWPCTSHTRWETDWERGEWIINLYSAEFGC